MHRPFGIPNYAPLCVPFLNLWFLPRLLWFLFFLHVEGTFIGERKRKEQSPLKAEPRISKALCAFIVWLFFYLVYLIFIYLVSSCRFHRPRGGVLA